MTQPTWQTVTSLGRFTTGLVFQVQLTALNAVSYKLLAGSLPPGTTLYADSTSAYQAGTVRGTIPATSVERTYMFTVRATSATGEITDRTFTIVAAATASVKFTQSGGALFSTPDSVWIDYNLGIDNPNAEAYDVWLVSGSLPPGLYLTKAGKIRGYPAVPMNELTGIAQARTYSFILAVDTNTVRDVKTFTITITVSSARPPVILNNTPPEDLTSDPYSGYYTVDGNFGVVRSGDEIAFKVIGKDFKSDSLTYVFSGLPAGLVGDPETGWVTGKITATTQQYARYYFSVSVRKTGAPTIHSATVRFSFVLANNMSGTITWKTDSTLPTLNAGETSYISIAATAGTSLSYSIVSGSLPPNLYLNSNGDIYGRVSFLSSTSFMGVGNTSSVKFKVRAMSPTYPEINSTREFTLPIYQPFSAPYDTLYFKVSPTVQDREIIDELLTNTDLIPTRSLYRAYDSRFGKSTGITIPVMFGVQAASFDQYVDAIRTNHYYKKLNFGELKTAIARDNQGNVIYEVVYVEITDDLVNDAGTSVSKAVEFTAQGTTVFPNSIQNMRDQVEAVLGRNSNTSLLPRWMSSQQADGNILGPIYAWVICYTLPGESAAIKSAIETNWYPQLKLVNAEIDRYYVDKSASFNWNSDANPPKWTSLPGGYPTPVGNEKDFFVIFPRKQIT